MANRKNRYPHLENVRIENVAAEAKSIAHIDDMVLFVPGVVPGDVVDVQVNKKQKNFMEGYVTCFHEYSSERCQPMCEHFGVCGGCKWQILPYERQLFYKQQQVADNLTRLGKFEMPEIMPILGSKQTEFYRNKLEYSFTNRRWLTEDDMQAEQQENLNGAGFHVTGKFDKIVNIEKCWLQQDPSNDIRNSIRDYANAHNISFYDIRQHTGNLRSLIIRTSTTGDIMAIVVFATDDKSSREGLLSYIHERFPQITSLLYVINEKVNDTITDQAINVYFGADHIIEMMENIKFKVGPKSFYQTNSRQAYELYKIAREFANLQGNEIVYDLYTGTGTIANFVAQYARKVVGIEYVPEAIEDAKVNSEINGITNTTFYAGDMKDVLVKSFIDENGKPDVVIVDPPRAGMHTDVIASLLYCDAPRIVYVSCNPATQARDITMLSEHYAVKRIQPVDMFPHTHHVENVVLLERK